MNTTIFTSESVTEGHPDKVCDYIADSILDAHLSQDPSSRVACEVLAKSNHLIIAGEIASRARVDIQAVAREAIGRIGYTDPTQAFCSQSVQINQLISLQSPEIAQSVTRAADQPSELGAGDQGIMFGYATDETSELLPLPILLAHRVARELAAARHKREVDWLRPDGKTQVSVRYESGRPIEITHVVVSTQHAPGVDHQTIAAFVRQTIAPRALGQWLSEGIQWIVNPSGSFVEGGPSADAGVTGRKIIVDTYGGFARHGGGAFSGKDPTKVDRSGAYFCRWAARQIVKQRLARRAELQVAYAIGQARPVSVLVETFGTGDARAAETFVSGLDFRPGAIIERLGLDKPIYANTTNYGHFGKSDLPWEQ